jgi:cation diffusion facilitator family transporter
LAGIPLVGRGRTYVITYGLKLDLELTVHPDPLAPWRHEHRYLGSEHERHAGRTRIVMGLTALTTAAEIAAGVVFGSIALLADGLHMAAHVAVLGAAAYAYSYARRHAGTQHYSFGTGKVGDLVAFASAIVLGVIALAILYESAQRLIAPQIIAYREALVVAVLGFSINSLCVGLLWDRELHEHVHGNDDHGHHHADHNFVAAYLHLLTDVLTSVLAIAALLSGLLLGWVWMDPLVGIVGALVVMRWAWLLLRRTSNVLLDATPDVAEAVKRAVESDADNRVADLHVWRIGPGHLAAMLTVVTREPRPPAHYKTLVAAVPGLSHVTVEVETWRSPAEPQRASDDRSNRKIQAARQN